MIRYVLWTIILLSYTPALSADVGQSPTDTSSTRISADFQAEAAFTSWLCYPPHVDLHSQLISAIDSARNNILLETPNISNRPIQEALVRALQRSVTLTIVLDSVAHKDQEYSVADFFADWGAMTYLYATGTMTAQVMIIDSMMVYCGSLNLKTGQENDLSAYMVCIKDQPFLISQFMRKFTSDKDYSALLPPKRMRQLLAQQAPVVLPITGEAQTTDDEQTESIKKDKNHRKKSSPEKYVGNRQSLIFHDSGCANGMKLSQENRVEFGSREEYLAKGYRACGRCKP